MTRKPGPGTCKRDGCERGIYARSLCKSHYVYFRKKLMRDGHAEPVPRLRDCIGDYLPGTVEDIARRAQGQYDWTRKIVRKMHAAGEMHIEAHQPPRHVGDKWRPVFALGPGQDATVDPEAKRQHARLRHRLRAYARGDNKPPSPSFAGLLAPLLQQGTNP